MGALDDLIKAKSGGEGAKKTSALDTLIADKIGTSFEQPEAPPAPEARVQPPGAPKPFHKPESGFRPLVSFRPTAPEEGTEGTFRIATPRMTVKGFLSPAGEAFNVASESLENFGNRMIDMFDFATYQGVDTKQKQLQMGAKTISFLAATANIAFTQISAELAAAQKIPVLNWAAKPVSWMFEQIGKGGMWLTGNALNALPISDEAKAILRQPIEELGAIAAPLAFVRVARVVPEAAKGRTELKPKTVTTPEGETFSYLGSVPTRGAKAAAGAEALTKFAFAPISETARLVTRAVQAKLAERKKAGEEVTPRVAREVVNEAVKEVPSEVPGVMSVKRMGEDGKINEGETVRIHTNQKLVLQNLLRGKEDIDYKVVTNLGRDTRGNPITARFEWDYKRQRATIYATNRTTTADLAHEFGHYLDRKTSLQVGKRLSEAGVDYAGSKADMDTALGSWALGKLGGSATNEQIRKRVARFVSEMPAQVKKLAPGEARGFGEQFAEAARTVLTDSKAARKAPEFASFIKYAAEREVGPMAKFIETGTKAKAEIVVPKDRGIPEMEVRKYKTVEDFIKKYNLKISDVPSTLFKGIGGGQPNINMMVRGTHFAGSLELAREFSRTPSDVRVVSLKEGTKIADLDAIKSFLQQRRQLADTDAITSALKKKGFDMARGSLPDGRFEYVAINEKAVRPLYSPRGKGITQLLKEEPFDTAEVKEAQKKLEEARGQVNQGFFEQRVILLREDILAARRIAEEEKAEKKVPKAKFIETGTKAKAEITEIAGEPIKVPGKPEVKKKPEKFILPKTAEQKAVFDRATRWIVGWVLGRKRVLPDEEMAAYLSQFKSKKPVSLFRGTTGKPQELESWTYNMRTAKEFSIETERRGAEVVERRISPDEVLVDLGELSMRSDVVEAMANTLKNKNERELFENFIASEGEVVVKGIKTKAPKAKFVEKEVAPYIEKEGRGLMEIENADLTLPELRKKLEIAREGKEDADLVSLIERDISTREVKEKPVAKFIEPAKKKPEGPPPFAGKPITTKAFNEAKMNAPEDVLKVLNDVAASNAQFSEQRRSATLDEIKAFSKRYLGDENLYRNIPAEIRENIGRMKAAEQTMVDMATELRNALKETDMSVATDAEVSGLRDKLVQLEKVTEAFAGARTEASHLFASLKGEVSPGENQIMRNLFGEMKKAGLDTTKIENFFRDKEAVKKDVLYETKDQAMVGVWYSFLLSGPTTFIKNIVSTAGSVASEVVSASVRKPTEIPASIGKLWDGLMDGWAIAKEVVLGKRPGAAEEAKFTKEIRGAKIPYEFKGRAKWLNQLRIVGRLLAASDTVFNEGLRQMELAGLKTDMPRPAEMRKLAEFHAKKEGYRGKELEAKTEEYIKNPDLIMGDLASKFALEGTYNNDPVGVLGAISDGIRQITRKKPVGKFVVPFTRVVANVISRGIDYTPYGFTRIKTGEGIFGGLLSGKLGGEVAPERTVRQQRQQLARAVVGTVFMGLAAALAADDRLSGNGPANFKRRSQLMDSGWRPNSIKIGDRWLPYINLGPLALPLAIAGNASDAIKYKALDEESTAQRVVGAIAGSIGTVFEMSFLTGASDFMSIAASGDPEQLLKYVTRGLTGIVEPNLLKQVARYFDPTVYDPENVWERVLTDMRIAGLAGVKPKLNVFGEVVEADRFYSLEPVKESKDPIIRFLAKNQLWIAVPGKNTQIKVGRDSRPMTPDEYYQYVEESGPAIKEQIARKMDRIGRQETRDKMQDIVDDIVRDERARVKNRIQREARRGE